MKRLELIPSCNCNFKPDINPFVVMRRAQNDAVILTVVTPGILRGPTFKHRILYRMKPVPP